MARDWEGAYQEDAQPWDTGVVEPHLHALVHERPIPRGRALEIGCGTGTNAIWLAEMGFDVVGIDIAPTAIALATAKAASSPASPTFLVHDFLADPIEHGPFDFIFDRGVFHVFGEPEERATFARRVAALLRPGGVWYSLIGSTEGPPRDTGPPRRSAQQVVEAIEPSLEVLSLVGTDFRHHEAAAWACLSRRRER